MHPILLDMTIHGHHVVLSAYKVMNLFLNPAVFVLLGTLFLVKAGSSKVRAFLSTGLLMLWVIVGARFAWVVLTMYQFGPDGKNPFQLSSGGFTMFGGFVLSFPFLWVFARIAGIGAWTFVDSVTPGWALGIAFNKIGCHLNGCCMGIPTNSWIGVKYPKLDYPNPVIPVQLLEAFVGFIGFLFVVFLLVRSKRFVGNGVFSRTLAHDQVKLREDGMFQEGRSASCDALARGHGQYVQEKGHPFSYGTQKEGFAFSCFTLIYALARLIFHFLRERPAPLLVDQILLISAYGAFVLIAMTLFATRVLRCQTP